MAFRGRSATQRGKHVSPVDKPLGKGKAEVSHSAFAFLFSELVQYSQAKCTSLSELERRLHALGYGIGQRYLELASFRDKGFKRETKFLNMLVFIQTTMWKALFGKQADVLERSTEHEDEFMISEQDPLVNRFVSIPKEMSQLNCAEFAGGIINGALDAAGFDASVSTHWVSVPGQSPRTTWLVKFKPHVMARERRFSSVS